MFMDPQNSCVVILIPDEMVFGGSACHEGRVLINETSDLRKEASRDFIAAI
jgi:hypothetical protein